MSRRRSGSNSAAKEAGKKLLASKRKRVMDSDDSEDNPWSESDESIGEPLSDSDGDFYMEDAGKSSANKKKKNSSSKKPSVSRQKPSAPAASPVKSNPKRKRGSSALVKGSGETKPIEDAFERMNKKARTSSSGLSALKTTSGGSKGKGKKSGPVIALTAADEEQAAKSTALIEASFQTGLLAKRTGGESGSGISGSIDDDGGVDGGLPLTHSAQRADGASIMSKSGGSLAKHRFLLVLPAVLAPFKRETPPEETGGGGSILSQATEEPSQMESQVASQVPESQVEGDGGGAAAASSNGAGKVSRKVGQTPSVRIGSLADLNTPHPKLYLEWGDEGRLMFSGVRMPAPTGLMTFTFPSAGATAAAAKKAAQAALKRASSVPGLATSDAGTMASSIPPVTSFPACDCVVTFPKVSWVGRKEDNPEEKPLALPEGLKQSMDLLPGLEALRSALHPEPLPSPKRVVARSASTGGKRTPKKKDRGEVINLVDDDDEEDASMDGDSDDSDAFTPVSLAASLAASPARSLPKRNARRTSSYDVDMKDVSDDEGGEDGGADGSDSSDGAMSEEDSGDEFTLG